MYNDLLLTTLEKMAELVKYNKVLTTEFAEGMKSLQAITSLLRAENKQQEVQPKPELTTLEEFMRRNQYNKEPALLMGSENKGSLKDFADKFKKGRA